MPEQPDLEALRAAAHAAPDFDERAEAARTGDGPFVKMPISRQTVTVLLTFGDQAHLKIASRGTEPLRVPAADITADTGIPPQDLPGKRLTALVSETSQDGMTVREYRLDA